MADIPTGFCFPPGATGEAAAIAQVAVYSSPAYVSLGPYFAKLGWETVWERPSRGNLIASVRCATLSDLVWVPKAAVEGRHFDGG
jgi:hypothetical protein